MTWRSIVLVALVSGCKLLHRGATDAGTMPPPAETTATMTMAIAPAPSATDSAPVAIASTSASGASSQAVADPHLALQQALREASEFGMLGFVTDGGISDDPGMIRAFGPTGTPTGVSGVGLADGGVHSSIRLGTVTVNGRLPPEVIQRIVKQNFGRFRLCYQVGLQRNPTLQGRVATKLVIARDGSVSSSQDNGSDMPDQGVVMCVVRAFGNLSFPQPEGGIVTVVAPIVFSRDAPHRLRAWTGRSRPACEPRARRTYARRRARRRRRLHRRDRRLHGLQCQSGTQYCDEVLGETPPNTYYCDPVSSDCHSCACLKDAGYPGLVCRGVMIPTCTEDGGIITVTHRC